MGLEPDAKNKYKIKILIDSGIYIYNEVQYHYISYVVTLRQAMEIEKQRGFFSKCDICRFCKSVEFVFCRFPRQEMK